MPAFLGGPDWPELDAALLGGDLPSALRLAEESSQIDRAERLLIAGICRSFLHQGERAAEALLDSFRTFSVDRPVRAAVAAVAIGRMNYWLHDSPHVANGWFARARTLVAGHDDALESGLVVLPLPGCDVDDVSGLRVDAELALALARRHGERNLEAKALADLGTALVSLAEVQAGMNRLDEAMTMLLSGEANSPFVVGDIVCNLLTACGRVGDLARADEWTRVIEHDLGIDVDHGPTYLYAHCRSVMGLILCDVGRWREAEVTLRLAGARAAGAGPRSEGKVRAALAELWVLQGRLRDAERLLNDRREHMDAAVPRALLHAARCEHADTIGVTVQALRQLGADRMRASRLLGLLVEAQLALADEDAAAVSAARLADLASGSAPAVVRARAALAQGLVAAHAGAADLARRSFENGLRGLGDADWPLLRAELRLRLGQALAGSDPAAAIAEARAAHLIWERLGSPRSADSAQLLNDLGLQASSTPRAIDSAAVLTGRELDVLHLLRSGASNAEIAADLHNSVRTIEHHVSSILAKLGLRSRAEAAVYAATLESATPSPLP